jgi:hypothetical protein
VLGKPHCVTEYNHSAPNTYGSEGFLLLAAYGALQDWDAIYAFAYSHGGPWDKRRLTGFFDLDQHPTKMATLPAAAALFLREDVRPAREQVVAALDKEGEVDRLRTASAWDLVHAGHLGVPRPTALVHRIALATEGGKTKKTTAGKVQPKAARHASDTSELLWDLRARGRGVVTINTPRSKGVIGYGGGKRYDLGGVVVQPGATRQDGWCTVTLTVMEGKLAGGRGRLLVTATGYVQNTGMKWKGEKKESVGRAWGRAPSLVEGIPCRLTLPRPAKQVRAWVLDSRGQRGAALVVKPGKDGKAVLDFGPRNRTLWYEVEVK